MMGTVLVVLMANSEKWEEGNGASLGLQVCFFLRISLDPLRMPMVPLCRRRKRPECT